jgi:hypothetical protein
LPTRLGANNSKLLVFNSSHARDIIFCRSKNGEPVAKRPMVPGMPDSSISKFVSQQMCFATKMFHNVTVRCQGGTPGQATNTSGFRQVRTTSLLVNQFRPEYPTAFAKKEPLPPQSLSPPRSQARSHAVLNSDRSGYYTQRSEWRIDARKNAQIRTQTAVYRTNPSADIKLKQSHLIRTEQGRPNP